MRDEPSFLDLARAQIVLDLTSGDRQVQDRPRWGDGDADRERRGQGYSWRLIGWRPARARTIGAARATTRGSARLALADLAAQDRDDDSALSRSDRHP
ncbi:MAG: hypothetical protein U0841_29330 [Chloroflexia bacterium]